MQTNSLTTSQVKNGSAFVDTGKVLVSASVPNVITSKDLNQIEMTRSPLTALKYHEHKGIEYAVKSLAHGSVYEGHDNETIFRNIKTIIKELSSLGVLPDSCYLGRKPFAGIKSLTRAAIFVDPDRLHRRRDNIIEYAMLKGYEPEELLRVLNFCAINAAANGLIDFKSVTCQKGFNVLRALPVSVRSGVLQGRYKTVRLFSAV